jgi:TetR/AcrR family transcriptional regulator
MTARRVAVGRVGRGGRHAQPRLETRERILAGALDIFAERGFDGATTRDIAARAGTNLGLIQYHFGGKERLWRAAVDRVFGALGATLAEAVPGQLERPEQLAEIVRVCVRFIAVNPHLVRLMNDECKRDGRRMRWLVDRHGRRLYDTAVAVFEQARQRGFLPDLPASHAYYLFIGAAGMIFSQAPECRRLTGTDPTASAAAIAAHADAMVRLFVRPPVGAP